MNNMLIKKIKNKIKVKYENASGNNWKLTSFDNHPEIILAAYELFPPKQLKYEHVYADPIAVYHFQESKKIRILKDVIIWPHYSIIAIDSDTLIRESAFSNHRCKYFVNNKLSDSFPLYTESDLCTTIEQGHWNNYYHWHIDTLPRLYGLHHPEIKKYKKIKLFVSDTLNKTELECVQALIPPNTEVISIDPRSRIYANNYIHLPYLSGEWEGYLPKEYINFYREKMFSLFGNHPIDFVPTKNIFISRRKADVRRIINEDEVYSTLRHFEFERYDLENLSIPEQVQLFRRAKMIVGQHGAGLTNMLYADHAAIIEIFSSNYPGLNHYRLLAASLGHEYINLFGGKIFRKDELQVPWKLSFSVDLVNNDIIIDPKIILSAVEKLNNK